MSNINLGALIRKDHLTCTICVSEFDRPKALPCLHTFCLSCLRDYVVGRGYESGGSFPCPVCRTNTHLPSHGVDGFPDNHIMSSLSDTVENLQPPRPVPRPRRSLGNVVDSDSVPLTKLNEPIPPSYESVADTDPSLNKVCSNDDDPEWMVVPHQEPTAPGACGHSGAAGDGGSGFMDHPKAQEAYRDTSSPQTVPHLAPVGGSTITPHTRYPHTDPMSPPPNYTSIAGPQRPPLPEGGFPSRPIGWNVNEQGLLPYQHDIPPVSYPTVPPYSEHSNVACRENLMLSFGKQGSSVRDFLKPVGLAVTSYGDYVISDNGGDQNRFFIYSSDGELKSAFYCGCKVKDIAVTMKDELVAAVHKNVVAIRHFSLTGQCKAEYGKFFTYEEASGIAELSNGGLVITGTANHCVYVLTNQMKLSVTFGRKGNGDGYFIHPGHVARDSKNHIIVSDKVNNSVQVFTSNGTFKLRFGSTGSKKGQLMAPLGVCSDNLGNIIVADSGNHRVEVFSPRGKWLSRVVEGTNALGENVSPVNVAWTPTGKVAVLLRGPYFAEVRIYSTRHQEIPQHDSGVSVLPSVVGFGFLNQ